MQPPTIAQLVNLLPGYAPGEDRLLLGADGAARARLDGIEYDSVYQPIFDAGHAGITQSLSAAPHDVAHFGDEIGFQGMLRRIDDPHSPTDPLSFVDDASHLVGMDRLSRMLHAINFFGAGRPSMLFLSVHEHLLKSVKYRSWPALFRIAAQPRAEPSADRHRIARKCGRAPNLSSAI